LIELGFQPTVWQGHSVASVSFFSQFRAWLQEEKIMAMAAAPTRLSAEAQKRQGTAQSGERRYQAAITLSTYRDTAAAGCNLCIL